MAFDNTTAAKRILDNTLSEDAILAISIMDINGTILASKSKQSFREKFGSTRDGEKYGGSLAVAVLSLVNEVKDVVGEAQAIITIHDNCKLMLLPMLSYRLLIGLVVKRSVNVEDDYFTSKLKNIIGSS